jgi:hypothetical protein
MIFPEIKSLEDLNRIDRKGKDNMDKSLSYESETSIEDEPKIFSGLAGDNHQQKRSSFRNNRSDQNDNTSSILKENEDFMRQTEKMSPKEVT